MKLESFIGLVGGKPRFAYYFVGHLEKPAGVQDANDNNNFQQVNLESEEAKYDESDRLVFLDPHYVNP